jgi:hypothetical protein
VEGARKGLEGDRSGGGQTFDVYRKLACDCDIKRSSTSDVQKE